MEAIIALIGLAFVVAAVVAYKKQCDVVDLREELKDADAKITALLDYVATLQSANKKQSKKNKK